MTDDAPVIFKRRQSKPSQSSRTRLVGVSVAAALEDGAAQESGDSPAAAEPATDSISVLYVHSERCSSQVYRRSRGDARCGQALD